MISKTGKKSTDKKPIATLRGSGNIFRDFNDPNPDYEQLKGKLAARIIGVLDDRKLSVRGAQKLTGFAAADFSRIRCAKLDRFTIERLMMMLDRLGQNIDISVKFRTRSRSENQREIFAAV